MSNLSPQESAIEKARNQPQFGGMGSVKITYNPYHAEWTCQFNWSNNIAISASHPRMDSAIILAIKQVERTAHV